LILLNSYIKLLIQKIMKKLLIFAMATGMIALSSCEKQDTLNDFSADDSSRLKSASADLNSNEMGQVVLNFRTHLSGDEEVPANPSKATGQAIFQLSKDGMALSYKLIVANIENVRMAHIHVAAEGQNGPVVTWLYPSAPPAVLLPGKTNGILHQGTITSANLVGMLAGMELSDLVDLMVAGNTYVNVHTTQYPGGEIRGQIWGNVPGN
jgi:hypothetical protein